MMSLRRTTVLLIAGLLAGTAALIGGLTYFTTRNSMVDLRDKLIEQTSDAVLQRMEFYFGQAAPALGFADSLIAFDPDAMSEGHWQKAGLELALFLDAQPEITWIYFAEAETGNLLGAVRDDDGRLLFTRIHEDADRKPVSMEVQEDGTLLPAVLSQNLPDGYDARTRPWFATGMETPARTVAWTEPYVFLLSNIRGVTATLTRRDQDDKAIHIIGVDLDLSDTGEFLNSIQVGKTGAAFIVRSSGEFLSSEKDRPGEHLKKLRAALSSQTGLLKSAPVDTATRVEFIHDGAEYLAVFQPASKPGFFTAMILPKEDYLRPIRQNAWTTVIIGSGILVLAGLLGVLLSRRVTEPLNQITRELEEIGALQFPEDHLEFKSNIREIARLEASVRKMKASLLSFSRYVPKRLLRRMLAMGGEAKLGGKLRRITVQFTDLAGFTQMSESLTPSEAFDELHEFLEIISRELHMRSGITSSFTGDGTLGLYNAPDDVPDHETKAIEAALATVEALDMCNARRQLSLKNQLHARIGINTTEALVGNLGTSERFGYTAIGDGVNLASRLEGLNKLYGTQILAGSECRESTKESFDWRMIDRISVMGRNQPEEIYEPLGRKGETSALRLQVASLYETAMGHYFAGDFALSIEAFEAAADEFPDDGPTAVMLQRCRKFLKSERPLSVWDGVFVAPFK